MRSKIFTVRADQRSPASEDGFVISVSPREARRQLQVSLGLMALMAAGLAAVLAIHGLPVASHVAQQPGATKVAVQQPGFVRSLTALRAPIAADARQNWAPRS